MHRESTGRFLGEMVRHYYYVEREPGLRSGKLLTSCVATLTDSYNRMYYKG